MAGDEIQLNLKGNKMYKTFAVARKYGSKIAGAGAGVVALVSGSAHATLDAAQTAAIQTAITGASTDGLLLAPW